MHRAQATGNRLLSKRWNTYVQDLHKSRLRTVKPSIDNRPPQRFVHLENNMKRVQKEEERYTQIERDNRILLAKMSSIMRKTGTIDNKNEVELRSLNYVQRKRELMRITQENLAILKRIQSREPAYNHRAWEADARRHHHYLKNISQYPVVVPLVKDDATLPPLGPNSRAVNNSNTSASGPAASHSPARQQHHAPPHGARRSQGDDLLAAQARRHRHEHSYPLTDDEVAPHSPDGDMDAGYDDDDDDDHNDHAHRSAAHGADDSNAYLDDSFADPSTDGHGDL